MKTVTEAAVEWAKLGVAYDKFIRPQGDDPSVVVVDGIRMAALPIDSRLSQEQRMRLVEIISRGPA